MFRRSTTARMAWGGMVLLVLSSAAFAQMLPPGHRNGGLVELDRPMEVRGAAGGSVPPRGVASYGRGASRSDLLDVAAGGASSMIAGSVAELRQAGAAMRISGTPMAGAVRAFSVSADGATVVYIADQDTADLFELYSVPADGSAVPTKISAGLAFGAGDQGVRRFEIAPGGTRVVFLADPNLGTGNNDLYSAPIDGSATPVRLNTAAQAPVSGFGLSPDGTSVAFLGIDSTFGSRRTELYVAAVAVASSARQLSNTGATNAQGDVTAAGFSPDGARIVYAADALANNVFQWFGVATSAAAPNTGVQLSSALGSVSLAVFMPDSLTVVYTADERLLGVPEVFAVPVTGGTPVRLNPTMAGGGVSLLDPAPRGDRVAYLAQEDTDGVSEVYGARTTVAGSGTRLNSPLSGTQSAVTVNVGPDGTTVLYEADQNTVGTTDLLSAPIDGSARSSTLHGMVAPDDAGFFIGIGVPVLGSRAVYPVFGTAVQIYSVPFDGSGSFTLLNQPLPSGDTLFNAFLPFAATRLLAYGTGAAAEGTTRRIYVTAIRGDLAPEQVNVTATSTALGVLGYEIAGDESRVVYLQDQTTQSKAELYSVELDSDADGVGNATDNCPFLANPVQDMLVFEPTVVASNASTFSWGRRDEVRYVRGSLAGLPRYGTDREGSVADAESFEDPTVPSSGEGFYYLFKYDCGGGSYQTSPGAEPGRDPEASR